MTSIRIFPLCFAIIAWFSLSGLKSLTDNEADAANKQNLTISPISNVVESSEKRQEKKADENVVKVRSKKIIRVEAGSKQKLFIHSEIDTPLDLSVPFKATEKFDLEKKWLIPHKTLDVFAVDPNKKARSLELNGDLLMSPDPQPEKRKSLDGAGITINLKP
ncbi:MAG: hypothetical protein NT008_05540 [Methylococcales bacterium]|jgi:hypothetical protein|nr:hypothetical protein [Methylococcales bacterium]